MDWQDLLGTSGTALGWVDSLRGLLVVLVLAQIIALHYQRFARVLSNRRGFAPVLVLIAATTMLVISVVKTSLALSLGLVGALSIIRFRTPIKEPEELAYLFLAVALGVGVGADQVLVTVLLVVGILIYRALSGGVMPAKDSGILLHIRSPHDLDPFEQGLAEILDRLREECLEADLRRVDHLPNGFEAMVHLRVESEAQLGSLMGKLRERLPDAHLSAVETDGIG